MRTMSKRASNATRSGDKFKTATGISAIKDGIKTHGVAPPDGGRGARERKPDWLRVRIGGGARYDEIKKTVRDHRLATVCEESHCPNIGECWNNGTATIMLMGLGLAGLGFARRRKNSV